MAVSCCLAMVGFQQSAQPFNANDVTLVSFMFRFDDPVDTLVDPLMVVVLKIFGEDMIKLLFR